MVLRHFFREFPKLGRRDRGIVAEAVFTVLRRLNSFTLLAGGRTPRRLFILGAHLREQEGTPVEIALSDDERDWLSQVAHTDLGAEPLSIRADLPEWILDALAQTMPEADSLALGLGMQSPAPLDLRVNTLRSTRDETLAQLAASGIASAPTPHAPLGLRVVGKPALETHELYQSGTVEVQDEGSQLARLPGRTAAARARGRFLRRRGRQVAHARGDDAFAGPRLRVRRLPRPTRAAETAAEALAGLSNLHPHHLRNEHDTKVKRLAGKIDRVLVDAPCSGLGTLRRNPDLKWRQSPAERR